MMAVIAEMMIFANAAVARRIHEAFPDAALLRRHPPPRQEAFAEVGGWLGFRASRSPAGIAAHPHTTPHPGGICRGGWLRFRVYGILDELASHYHNPGGLR